MKLFGITYDRSSKTSTLTSFLCLCFQENAAVRASSIELFGNLSRFGHGPSEPSFLEQIHTNFISILLHLNEEDEVKKVRCSMATRILRST